MQKRLIYTKNNINKKNYEKKKKKKKKFITLWLEENGSLWTFILEGLLQME